MQLGGGLIDQAALSVHSETMLSPNSRYGTNPGRHSYSYLSPGVAFILVGAGHVRKPLEGSSHTASEIYVFINEIKV